MFVADISAYNYQSAGKEGEDVLVMRHGAEFVGEHVSFSGFVLMS